MVPPSLLFKKEVEVTSFLTIRIPTVGEILDDPESYNTAVSMFTSVPMDLMVQLDDIGVDFTQVDDYELFMILFSSAQSGKADLSIIFPNLDISSLFICKNTETDDYVVADKDGRIIFDKLVYAEISDIFRRIGNVKKNNKKPANETAKKYMIKRARDKMKRHANDSRGKSQLEELVVALVNTEQFKYDFEGTMGLTIYQFNECVQQVVTKINYDNRMHGVYAGTIDSKKLSQDDLNWLAHK